jgi:hypothetical protein
VAELFAATTKGLNTLVQAGEKLVFVTLEVWRSLRNKVQLALLSSITGHRDISQDQQEHPCSEKKELNMQRSTLSFKETRHAEELRQASSHKSSEAASTSKIFLSARDKTPRKLERSENTKKT